MNNNDRSISHLNRILSLTKCKNCFKYKITKMKAQCRHLLCSECDTLSCKICSKHSIGIDIHVYTFLHDLLSRNCDELNEFKIYRKKEDIWVESQDVFEENLCLKNNGYKSKYDFVKEGKHGISDLKGEILNLKSMFLGEEKNTEENKKNNENEIIATLAESSFAIPFTSPLSTQKSNQDCNNTQSVSSNISKTKEIRNEENLCLSSFYKDIKLREKKRNSRFSTEYKIDEKEKQISLENIEITDKIEKNCKANLQIEKKVLTKSDKILDNFERNCKENLQSEKQTPKKTSEIYDKPEKKCKENLQNETEIFKKNSEIIEKLRKNCKETFHVEKEISKKRFDGIKISNKETKFIISAENHLNAKLNTLKNTETPTPNTNNDLLKNSKHEIPSKKSSNNPIISLTTKLCKNQIISKENTKENRSIVLPNLKFEPSKNITNIPKNLPNQLKQFEIQDQPNLDTFVFLTSGLLPEENNFISKTFWSLQNKLNIPIEIKSEYSSSITHLIVNVDQNGCCLRTLKYLLCILSGVKVMPYSWYKNLIKPSSLEDKDYFIKGDNISGVNNIPYQIYKNTQNGIFYFNKINFLIEKKFITKDLRKVIKNGKGKINENNFEFTNLKVQNEKEVYNFISNGTFLNYKSDNEK